MLWGARRKFAWRTETREEIPQDVGDRLVAPRCCFLGPPKIVRILSSLALRSSGENRSRHSSIAWDISSTMAGNFAEPCFFLALTILPNSYVSMQPQPPYYAHTENYVHPCRPWPPLHRPRQRSGLPHSQRADSSEIFPPGFASQFHSISKPGAGPVRLTGFIDTNATRRVSF